MAGAVSCEDFLERAPGDNMTKEELFSNIQTAEEYLDNAYCFLPDFQTNTEDLDGRYKLGDATDEGGFQQASGYPESPFDINLGSWNPTQMPMKRNWRDYYGCIRRCNNFIENYNLIPEDLSTGGASNRRERLLGEAYGLRGYYYFLLFKQWGGVPLITSVLDPGNEASLQGIKRATAEQTLQQVLNDMDEAIKYLPAKHDDGNYGRFTSIVATVVKSQVKLYWASKYWNRENDLGRWEEAKEACREALNMAEKNGHILSLKYSDLFNRATIEPEVIWTKNSERYECYWWDVYSMPLGYNAYNVDGPLQELVDDFEMKATGKVPVLGYNSDNTQIIDETSGYDPLHPWDGRDDRFYSCILYHGATLQGRAIDISASGKDNINIGSIIRTNYFNNKYLDQNHNLNTHVSWTYRRFAIMRTAELYLNYADTISEIQFNLEETLEEMNISITNIGLGIAMNLKNTLPLGLKLNLIPLDAQNNPIQGIKIESIDIPAGKGQAIAEEEVEGTPVELSIECDSPDTLSALDKIAFSIEVKAGNGDNALSGKQGLQVCDIVLEVKCDAEMNLGK